MSGAAGAAGGSAAAGKNAGKFITFFGSARLADDTPECLAAKELARKIAERGCGIISGGGGGIMAAANAGAAAVGAASVGINIRLPHEQESNPFCTEIKLHSDISLRRKELIARADGFVVCAGGFGTMDELFEVLTLSQTNLSRKKIVLFGVDFWRPLVEGFFSQLAARGLIDAGSVLMDLAGETPTPSENPLLSAENTRPTESPRESFAVGTDFALPEGNYLAICSDNAERIMAYLGV